MSATMRSGLGRVLELETKVANQRKELSHLQVAMRDMQELHNVLTEWVTTYRTMLPGDKKPERTEDILKAFGEKAVQDIATLMAACIDYRNVLIRATIGDPVSGRHEGVDAICERYGVKIEKRKVGTEEHLHAYIDDKAKKAQGISGVTY